MHRVRTRRQAFAGSLDGERKDLNLGDFARRAQAAHLNLRDSGHHRRRTDRYQQGIGAGIALVVNVRAANVSEEGRRESNDDREQQLVDAQT